MGEGGYRSWSGSDHRPGDIGQWLADWGEAMAFLTRLPLLRRAYGFTGPALAPAMRAFPLAGLVVGLVSGFVLLLALLSGAPVAIGALVAVGAGILVTGGLHEDGLADVADGFGGGTGAEDKLAIMRDSRIGTYGVLALLFGVILKTASIAALAAVGSWTAFAVIAAAAALSRAVPVALMHALPPARSDGLAFAAGRPGRGTVLQSFLAALVISVIFLLPVSLLVGLLLMPVAALAGLAIIVWLANRHIGGQTGDVAGAAQVTSEVLALVAAAAVLGG